MATPEEAAMLDSWLAASPDNKQEFDRLWELWQMTNTEGNAATNTTKSGMNTGTNATAYVKPDVDVEWKALHTKMKAPFTPQSTPVAPAAQALVKSGAWKLLSIILVGMIIAGILLIKMNRPVTPQISRIERSSGGTVLTDTLQGHTIVTLDTQSRIIFDDNKVVDHSGSNDHSSYVDDSIHISGKAFIRMGERPLTFYAGRLQIRAINASFYLAHDSSVGSVSLQVTKGALQIKGNEREISLKEGQSLYYDAGTRQFLQKDTMDVNTFGFATRVFYFNDTPVREVIGYISRAYNVTFSLEDPAIGNCRITTQFDNKPVGYVLDVLTETLGLRYAYKEQGKIIVLSGQGCE
jgi:ferric-dicitrate binding protein FerR (iron transport regulator)